MSLRGMESSWDGRRVLLSERMVRELRMLAIEGFVALPRRGIEVGGILFGQTSGKDVQLAAFEEVACEHRFGPSYALTEEDRVNLKELLGRRDASRLPVVGVFRSFTSREPIIEAPDEALVREQFPAGTFVWLMLQPLSAEKCVATLRFFCDGQLLPESDDPPVVFDPQEMPEVEPVIADDAPGPAVRAAEPLARLSPRRPPGPPAGMPRPAPQDVPGDFVRVRWWAVAALFLVSLLGGALITRLLTRTGPAERWTELHLDARPVGNRLEVTWDAAAPRALSATKGLLAVTDGGTHRDIPLDAQQIRAGKYAYGPAGGDVALRLILYAKGQGAAGDAVRVAVKPQNLEGADADRALAVTAPPRATGKPVPPAIVHEVQPSVPEGIRSRMTREVVIPVEVRVDEQGQVVRAVSKVRGSDSVRRYLSEQAQKAAREWRFTPARTESGQPVAANKTLRFVFTP